MGTRVSAYECVGWGPRARRSAIALVVAVAVVLGLAGPAMATGHPEPVVTKMSRSSGGGTIEGHVTLPTQSDEYEDANGKVFVRNHREHRSARLDSQGNYRVADLPDGSYRVVFARLSGYASVAAQFYRGQDESQAPGAGRAAAQDVVVRNGSVVDGVDATLHPGGSIDGVLRDAAGQPLAYCYLQAYTADGTLVTRDGETRSDGSFDIGGLTTGHYQVRVLGGGRRGPRSCHLGVQFVISPAGGFLGGRGHAADVAVVRGRTTNIHAQTYDTGGEITGHVDFPSGALDGDHYVAARRHHHVHRVAVDSAGNYTIPFLTTGSYRLTFDRVSGLAYSAPLFYRHGVETPSEPGGFPAVYQPVTVASAHTTTAAAVTLAKGGVLTGTVRGPNGVGLGDCYVQAYTADGRLVTRTAFTDATGAFAVGGLSTGGYLLRVLPRKYGGCNYRQQFYVGTTQLARTPGGSEAVQVRAGHTASIGYLTYTRGADISGHVAFSSVESSYEDRVVILREGHLRRKAYVDRHGDYQFRGLPSGSYRVTFNRISGYASSAAQFYDGKDESQTKASATRVRVRPGEARSGIDATLLSGGHLTGTLHDQNGQPLQCFIQLFTPDGSLVTRDAFVQYDGTFDIGGLTTGDYDLRVVELGYRGDRCAAGTQFLQADGSLSTDGPGATTHVVQGATTALPHPLTYLPTQGTIANAGRPTISGALVVGSTLTADPGRWTSAPTSFRYQWRRDGAAIPGAVGATYLVTAADVGTALAVRVTAGRAQYVGGRATSSATGPVLAGSPAVPLSPTPTLGTVTSLVPTTTAPAAFVVSHRPRLAGTLRPAHLVRVKAATISPAATSVHFRWFRNGTRIKHATGSRHTLTRADTGAKISVRVTYVRAGYDDLTVTTRPLRVS